MAMRRTAPVRVKVPMERLLDITIGVPLVGRGACYMEARPGMGVGRSTAALLAKVIGGRACVWPDPDAWGVRYARASTLGVDGRILELCTVRTASK